MDCNSPPAFLERVLSPTADPISPLLCEESIIFHPSAARQTAAVIIKITLLKTPAVYISFFRAQEEVNCASESCNFPPGERGPPYLRRLRQQVLQRWLCWFASVGVLSGSGRPGLHQDGTRASSHWAVGWSLFPWTEQESVKRQMREEESRLGENTHF